MPFLRHLLSLPTELLVPILDELDGPELLSCKKCSPRLQAVIQATNSLQYKLELALAGKIDGPPSPIPIADRLAAVHAYRVAWAAGQHPLERDSVEVVDNFYAPSGALICSQMSGENKMRVRRQKGAFCGVEGREMMVDGWHRYLICNFAVDESQKLVVREGAVMKHALGAEATEWPCCGFLALEDGFPVHPLAGQPHIQACVPSQQLGDPEDLQIIGDVFGWNAPVDTYELAFDRIVYNWKTGVRLWHAHLSGDFFIHLLSQERFIIVDRRALTIRLYAIDPDTSIDSPPLPLDSGCLCILQLPTLSSTAPHPVRVKSTLQHPSSFADAQPLFQHDPALTALVLDFRFGPETIDGDGDLPSHPDLDHHPPPDYMFTSLKRDLEERRGDEERHVLIVPITTILKAHEALATATPRGRGPPVARWEAWGPGGTRMFRAPRRCGRPSSAVGAQVAFLRLDDASGEGEAAVYEAFPLAAEGDVGEPAPDDAMSEEDVVENPEKYWTNLGRTTYPVRRTRTVVRIVERAEWRWRRVLLSHDGLVLLNVRRLFVDWWLKVPGSILAGASERAGVIYLLVALVATLHDGVSRSSDERKTR